MKRGCCIGCAVVLALIVAFIGFTLYLLFADSVQNTTDIAYYQALSGETEGPNSLPILGEQIDIYCPYEMPKLSELEPCEEMHFLYQARRMIVFESHSYILRLRYDAAGYEAQMAAFEEAYEWESELIPGETEGVAPDFALDGYRFRCVEGGYYPKEMLCIGTREEDHEIVILYFHDQDLDFVSPDMAAFLRDETCWSEVVGE